MNPKNQKMFPRRHEIIVRVFLVLVAIGIVVSSLMLRVNTQTRASLIHVDSSLMPTGEDNDDVRKQLLEIHAQFVEQMERADELSAQNSSMLSLYQNIVLPIEALQQSSINHSLAPLPSAPSLVLPSVSSRSSSAIASSLSFRSSASSRTLSSSSSSSSSNSSSSLDAYLLALRETFGRTISILDAPKRALVYRLMTGLTLTPVGEEAILSFATQHLPTATVDPQYADSAFRSFKLLNGAELKKIGIIPNADVDPKDWYAESVMTMHALGVMQGSGKTGLFEAERTMSQAELARTLANAMNRIGGTLLYPAAPNADVFRAWPSWAKDAVSELRARGIDTSFLRADPSEPVHRLQLARAMSDTIFHADTVDFTKTLFFRDTVTLPQSVQFYIAKMSSLGIMTGNSETQMFDPYAYTNRAQVAKTVMFAMRVKVNKSSQPFPANE